MSNQQKVGTVTYKKVDESYLIKEAYADMRVYGRYGHWVLVRLSLVIFLDGILVWEPAALGAWRSRQQ